MELLSQQDIAEHAISHFRKQYQRMDRRSFQDILWGIEAYSMMFNEEENVQLFRPIFEEQLLATMKSFSKDKSPGPDG